MKRNRSEIERQIFGLLCRAETNLQLFLNFSDEINKKPHYPDEKSYGYICLITMLANNCFNDSLSIVLTLLSKNSNEYSLINLISQQDFNDLCEKSKKLKLKGLRDKVANHKDKDVIIDHWDHLNCLINDGYVESLSKILKHLNDGVHNKLHNKWFEVKFAEINNFNIVLKAQMDLLKIMK